MKNKPTSIGANCSELEKASGVRVLFSYHTPVAAYVPGRGYIQTVEKFSVTTSRHINAWAYKGCPTVEQSEIDALL